MNVKLKVITLFSLITLLIYLWIPFNGGQLHVVQARGTAAGSTIGGIVVSGLNEQEMRSTLELAISEWKQNGDFLVQGAGVELPLSKDYFEFDVNSSVNQLVNSTSKAWFEFWKAESTVNLPLTLTVNPKAREEIDSVPLFVLEDTYQNVVNHASSLSNNSVEATVADLSIYDVNRIAFTTETFDESITELTNISSQLNDTLIPTGEVFSFMGHIDSSDKHTLNFVASMLYSLVLQTDYEVVERHSQNLIPNYLSAGIEAKVDRSLDQDFQFISHANAPSKLKMKIEGNSLKMEIYTVPMDTKVSYQVLDKMEITPQIIYRYSSNLAIGEEQLIQEGKPGLRVSVYRTVSGNEQLISKDFYPPVNRIVLKSSKQPITSPTTDEDLNLDLDGDGLPDFTETENGQASDIDQPKVQEQTEGSITETEEEDGLPEGSYYDKAGNVINGNNS